MCKARFVLTWWEGSEGLAGSPLGGVALILAWQKDVLASYQHGVGLSGSSAEALPP